jgi:FKBP-type peptidyl-prolyl cis-trans isomerase
MKPLARHLFATSLVCLALMLGCDRPNESILTAPAATPAATPAAPAATPAATQAAQALAAPAAMPGAPAVPPDVKAAPANATKTASGLAYRVLTKGTGKRHPTATDNVKVHYSGWTTDGKMFDSSVARGEPASFPLNGVIKGWTEGVQLMVEGEKTRFWIPGKLAYGDTAGGGRPSGTLVFDIELIAIQ